MALDFPSNPANGQTYNGYVYSTSIGAWQAKPAAQSPFYTSDTPPANPTVGDAWFNTIDGTAYFYYYDGNTYQWVEGTAPITANGYYSPNYLINGAFDIWQRGTSFASERYTADRWYATNLAGTWAQETTTVPAGFQNAMKFTASASGAVYMMQAIETLNAAFLSGKTVTLSAYVASSVALNSSVVVQYSTTVDNAMTNVWTTLTAVSGGSVTTSGSVYSRISGVYMVPSTAKSLRVYVTTLGMVSGNIVYYSGLQLEEGSTATSFRRNANSIQGELATCHRYFRRYTSTTGDEIMWNGTWYEAGALWVPMIFPTPMRIKPVVSWSGTINCYGGGGASTITNIGEYAGGVPTATGGVYIFQNTGGNTVGRSGFVGLANAGNYIQFNAEL